MNLKINWAPESETELAAVSAQSEMQNTQGPQKRNSSVICF